MGVLPDILRGLYYERLKGCGKGPQASHKMQAPDRFGGSITAFRSCFGDGMHFARGGVCVASSKSHGAFIWLAVYLGMNVAYSLGLKNVPLVDIAILAAGFLIRILYGACLTQIVISNWLYLTVMAMALYFALGKRRNELKRLGGETRAVLKAYPVSFLDKNMSMCLTLANVFYALWSMDANTQQAYHSDFVIFTVPIVLLITLRYSMNVEGDSDGDPVEVLLHDKTLLLLCLVYAAAMFIILYVF